MLYRAAVIYVMSVVIMLLAATVAWQRIAMASLSSDATTTSHLATELRDQLDNAHATTGEAERLVRISKQGFEDEAAKRERAEKSLGLIRTELDAIHGSTQTATQARKEAESQLDQRRSDLEAQARALLLLRAELAAARAEASTAKTALDALRRQLPMATTGSISSTTGTAGEPAEPGQPEASAQAPAQLPTIAVDETESGKTGSGGSDAGLLAPNPASATPAGPTGRPVAGTAKENPPASAARKDGSAGQSAKAPSKPGAKPLAGHRSAHRRELGGTVAGPETSLFPF